MNKTKMTTSPLEDIFGIESGTTISTIQTPRDELVVTPTAENNVQLINEEDKEINSQLASIYGYAMDAFEQQTQMVQEVDPRFAARNAEVAAQYLNIALNSIGQKAKIRHDKLKLETTITNQTPGAVNNNLIITADRNEILKMLIDADSKNKH
jgi:hypothetical protein